MQSLLHFYLKYTGYRTIFWLLYSSQQFSLTRMHKIQIEQVCQGQYQQFQTFLQCNHSINQDSEFFATLYLWYIRILPGWFGAKIEYTVLVALLINSYAKALAFRTFRCHLHYGNTDCGVFKRGVQNQKDFCLRINILKGKVRSKIGLLVDIPHIMAIRVVEFSSYKNKNQHKEIIEF